MIERIWRLNVQLSGISISGARNGFTADTIPLLYLFRALLIRIKKAMERQALRRCSVPKINKNIVLKAKIFNLKPETGKNLSPKPKIPKTFRTFPDEVSPTPPGSRCAWPQSNSRSSSPVDSRLSSLVSIYPAHPTEHE